MSTEPKKPEEIEGLTQPRGEDNWGIGEMADGTINVIPEDKLLESVAERDADESAFAAMLAGIDLDDVSDLDDD